MATRSEHVIAFRAQFKNWQGQFSRAQRSVGRFARGIGGFMPGMDRLLGGAGLASMVHQWGQQATRIRDLNRQTGIAHETLQQMEYAAKQTGVQLDDLVKLYMRLAEIQERVRRGQKEATSNVQALGLDPKKIVNMTTMDFMRDMAKNAMGQSQLGALRMMLPELGPRFRQFVRGGGMGSMTEASFSSGDLIERTAKAMDNLTMVMNKVTADLAPALTALAEAIAELSQIVIGWRNLWAAAGAVAGGEKVRGADVMMGLHLPTGSAASAGLTYAIMRLVNRLDSAD